MSRRPVPEDAGRVKLSPGLRLQADGTARDAAGRILSKQAQRAADLQLKTAAEIAALKGAAGMLPARPDDDRAQTPPVSRNSKGDHV